METHPINKYLQSKQNIVNVVNSNCSPVKRDNLAGMAS